ncbi:hypothetical protein AB0J01_28045 [Streptomyces sp. NPDC050204]|uniref:hypothetical protein n=1 Tax=Streptomyces sp. NPDC050204 TaxID=3155514 RepID=UPI00343AEA70
MTLSGTDALPVRGTHECRGAAHLFVLDEQLTGRTTFLTTTLLIDPGPGGGPGGGEEPYRLHVRILTFDDVTVLSPLPGQEVPPTADAGFRGTLEIRHGWREPAVPEDLARAAAAAGIDTDAWSEAEARQVLTFLGEARQGSAVREQRLHAIVSALAAGS